MLHLHQTTIHFNTTTFVYTYNMFNLWYRSNKRSVTLAHTFCTYSDLLPRLPLSHNISRFRDHEIVICTCNFQIIIKADNHLAILTLDLVFPCHYIEVLLKHTGNVACTKSAAVQFYLCPKHDFFILLTRGGGGGGNKDNHTVFQFVR